MKKESVEYVHRLYDADSTIGRLVRSWLEQGALLEEVAKEPCDMAVCNNAHTPLFKAGTFCLPCRARALMAKT